jgi:hypothetical protein
VKYLQPSFTIPPPEKLTCCECCVYGRGEHAKWCAQSGRGTVEFLPRKKILPELPKEPGMYVLRYRKIRNKENG